jgi:hypothetical protein
MWRNWHGIVVTAVVLCVLGAKGAIAPTAAQQAGASPRPLHSDARIEFDIPEQPLGSALKAYGTVSRLELFYESSMVDHRRAPPLHGLFTRAAALQLLLDGTGFSVASLAPGTITLLPPPTGAANGDGPAVTRSRATEFMPYFALVQEGIRSAFCRSPAAETSDAELFIRLWIAPTGVIARAEYFPSPGSEPQSRAYDAAIGSIVIREPPPQRMPQPITVMVLPRASHAAAGCEANGHG